MYSNKGHDTFGLKLSSKIKVERVDIPAAMTIDTCIRSNIYAVTMSASPAARIL